jgi:hypothetical protein
MLTGDVHALTGRDPAMRASPINNSCFIEWKCERRPQNGKRPGLKCGELELGSYHMKIFITAAFN